MKSKLFIIILLMASCAVYAQEKGLFLDKKVTVSFNDITVDEALKRLASEVDGMVFMYSPSTFDLERRITFSFQDVALSEILNQVFKRMNVDFSERRNKILLKPGMVKPQLNGSTVAVKKAPKTSEVETGVPKRKSIRPADRLSKNQEALMKEAQQAVEEVGNSEKLQPTNVQSADSASFVPQFRAQPKPIPPLANDKEINRLPFAAKVPSVLNKSISQDSVVLDTKVYKRLLAKEKKEEAKANETKKFRIFGTAYTGYTSVGGNAGIQLGGSVVWLKNPRWGFGLSGYAVQARVIDDPVRLNEYRLAGGYGGVSVHYVLNPSDRIHFSFPLVVGAGGFLYKRTRLEPSEALVEDSTAFFMVEPGAMVEANVIKYLRVGFGLSYRFASNTMLNYQDTGDQIVGKSALTGLNFGLSVKFGLF